MPGNKIFNLKWQIFVLITNGSILFAISSFAILIEEITSCADSGTKKKCCKKLTRKLERKSPRSYKRQMFEVKATLIGLHLRPFVTGYNNGFKFFQNLKKVVRYWCISSKEFTFLVMSVFWNLDWYESVYSFTLERQSEQCQHLCYQFKIYSNVFSNNAFVTFQVSSFGVC